MKKNKKNLKDMKKPILVLPNGILSNLTSDQTKDLAAKSGVELSRIRKILKGDTNFTIESIEAMGEACGFQFSLYPIPSSNLFDAFLKKHAEELPCYWRLAHESDYNHLFQLFMKSIGTNLEKKNMKQITFEITTALHYACEAVGDNKELIQKCIVFSLELADFLLNQIDRSNKEETSVSK